MNIYKYEAVLLIINLSGGKSHKKQFFYNWQSVTTKARHAFLLTA